MNGELTSVSMGAQIKTIGSEGEKEVRITVASIVLTSSPRTFPYLDSKYLSTVGISSVSRPVSSLTK